MRKRSAIFTPSGYQVARHKEFKAAIKTLKELYPHEPSEEIKRIVWAFVMAKPARSRHTLVEKAIEVLGSTPTPPSQQHSTTKKASAQVAAIDTTTTIDRKFQSRQRDALTLSEKARQARGAAAHWIKRASAYAREGEFRAANDAQTEAVALGRMADDLEIEVARIRTRSHATMKKTTTSRWIHRAVARSLSVPEDVVRRIYAAVQTAKRQGLYGGYMADLSERSVGRKLTGAEYTVYARAKEHLGYDPPGGYGGPKPKGAAKEPPRVMNGKIESASRMAARANATIKDILDRRKHPIFGWDESNDSKDRTLLRQAADELDVAADLYEEAGAGVRAGTLHERARHARQGDYRLLAAYD